MRVTFKAKEYKGIRSILLDGESYVVENRYININDHKSVLTIKTIELEEPDHNPKFTTEILIPSLHTHKIIIQYNTPMWSAFLNNYKKLNS